MKTKIISVSIISVFLASALNPLGASHSGEFALADSLDTTSAETSSAVEVEPATPVVVGSYLHTFTISAYYSPLPCQVRYATGSYAADIRLNGGGVRGADGTPVYPGMIAAPREYAFGTKMHIPGVGIVAVHDRGGAIKSSGNIPGLYDRLDIWMGYGDEGLNRALKWGKRTLDVVVYGQNDAIAEQIELPGYNPAESVSDCNSQPLTLTQVLNDPAPTPTPTPTAQTPIPAPSPSAPEVSQPKTTPFESPVIKTEEVEVEKISDKTLSIGSSGNEVRALQEELKRLNFYKGDITGFFGDVTEHAVFKFQQSRRLVGDKMSLGAGVFGPKTRDTLTEILASRDFSQQLVAEVTDEYRIKNRILAVELNYGASSEHVRILQEFLKENGYFKGSFVTDFYGEVTKNAVLEFQLANGIISSQSDPGAGNVGPQTLKVINNLS